MPLNSSATTIQPGEWATIYGTNLASQATSWNGNFPTVLGGTSVKINGKLAYLWYVSPSQINFQSPDDTATGTVSVVVATAAGSATSTVTLGQFGPSFSLLDGKHVAGIIARTNGSGAYGAGTYDIVGPTGSSLGYPTVAAQPGDTLVLFGVGFGPTSPAVPAGQTFSGAAAATNPVKLLINNVSVTPSFAGLSGAGLFQINITIPSNASSGDVPLLATIGGVQTPTGVVVSLRAAAAPVQVQSVGVVLNLTSIQGGSGYVGMVALSGVAPVGGATVALSSNSSTVIVPASVTVPAGATSANFDFSVATVASNQTATITASYGGASMHDTFTVTPPPALSFSQLVLTGNWNVTGYPAIFVGFTVQPNSGVSTFTVSGGDAPSFDNCTASAGNTAFTCSAIAPGFQEAVLSASNIVEVSGGSLTLTLSPSNGASGSSFTGTLSVTGVPLLSGGTSATYSGSITGTYAVVP